MLQAGEMMKKPVLINVKTPVEKIIRMVVGHGAGLVYLDGHGPNPALITPVSILRGVAAGKTTVNLSVKDLSFEHYPFIRPEALPYQFFSDLEKFGALVVGAPGKIGGVVTAAEAVAFLAVKVEELESELSAVINCSSDEIVMTDGRGNLLRANAVFEDNFGVKLSAVIGKNVEDLEKEKVFFPSAARLAIEEKGTRTVIQTHRDGRKLLATGTPAFNQNGSIFRVIVNTRDITRLNKLKQQLEEAELLTNRYRQELIELHGGYKGGKEIVAYSPAFFEVIKVAQRIAAADSTVMLTGESGSGKGVIARYIHNCSRRSKKPFTVVNCGAIPENLLESELFGYEGGAFTGARKEGKIGKLELANEGTIFLDEIAELPLHLQVKLLQVIQEGVINRIGGAKEILLNLRFIAATNRDIAKNVEEGKFRDDLYFRLNVIPLHVPPLRERHLDIKPLTEQILANLRRRYGQYKTFSPEAYRCLELYHWPGNVRELQNLIERLMVVVDEDLIEVEHLPHYLTDEKEPQYRVGASGTELQSLKSAREQMEKDLFSEALRRYRTTYEIAEALQVDQSTVVRKLQKYKLTFPKRSTYSPSH